MLGDRAPTVDDLPRLAYCEQVVAESLRLYPPAYAIARRVLEPVELTGGRRLEPGHADGRDRPSGRLWSLRIR